MHATNSTSLTGPTQPLENTADNYGSVLLNYPNYQTMSSPSDRLPGRILATQARNILRVFPEQQGTPRMITPSIKVKWQGATNSFLYETSDESLLDSVVLWL